MKKVGVVLSVIASAWVMSASAEGVAIVDMKEIFASSPKVKEIKASLTKQFDSDRTKLQKMGEDLQAAIGKYQKNKDVMKKDEVTKTEADIGKQENAFRAAQAKFQQDVFNAQNKSLESFMDEVKSSVKKVAENNKYDLVVPSNDVLYSKNGNDITFFVHDSDDPKHSFFMSITNEIGVGRRESYVFQTFALFPQKWMHSQFIGCFANT